MRSRKFQTMLKLMMLILCTGIFMCGYGQVPKEEPLHFIPKKYEYGPYILKNKGLNSSKIPLKKLIDRTTVRPKYSTIITLPLDNMKCLVSPGNGFIPNVYFKGQELAQVIPIPNTLPLQNLIPKNNGIQLRGGTEYIK